MGGGGIENLHNEFSCPTIDVFCEGGFKTAANLVREGEKRSIWWDYEYSEVSIKGEEGVDNSDLVTYLLSHETYLYDVHVSRDRSSGQCDFSQAIYEELDH